MKPAVTLPEPPLAALRLGLRDTLVRGWLSAAQVGFALFFCDFQEENAGIAPFFVHFNKK